MSRKLLFAALLLSLLLAIFIGTLSPRAALLPYINQSFIIGLACLLISATIVVLRSGFFTTFSVGMKQLLSLFFRKPRALSDDLYNLDDPDFTKKRETFIQMGTTLLFLLAMILLLFSVVLTCFYYFASYR